MFREIPDLATIVALVRFAIFWAMIVLSTFDRPSFHWGHPQPCQFCWSFCYLPFSYPPLPLPPKLWVLWVKCTSFSLIVALAWNACSRDSFFLFFFRYSCNSSDPTSSSTESVDKFLDSSIMHTIFSKLSINNLRIFSTIWLVGNVSQFLPNLFNIFSTREMYSATPLTSFSLFHPLALKLAFKSLKSGLLYTIIPLIFLFQYIPHFFWSFNICYLLIAWLIDNSVQ